MHCRPAVGWCGVNGFNEAAGADPADARVQAMVRVRARAASMRPRGQTPRMPPLPDIR